MPLNNRPPMFTFKTRVRLYHTDAAGILFYSRIYNLAHDAYEEMLRHAGLDVRTIITKSDFLFPFVHSEADYRKMITVGEELEIRVNVEKIGKSSFTLLFRFINSNQEEAAVVKTVSVSVDKKSGQKIPLPEQLLRAILKLESEAVH